MIGTRKLNAGLALEDCQITEALLDNCDKPVKKKKKQKKKHLP